MNPAYTFDKLIEEYHAEVEPAVHSFIKEEISQKKASYLDKIDTLIKVASTGDLNAVLTNLDAFKLSERPTSWVKGMDDAVKGTPALVLLDQDESHFSSGEEDNFGVVFWKGIKRIGRSAGKTGIGVQNAFRRAAKKEEKEWEYPKREVPFRNLIETQLFDLEEVFRNLESFLSAYHARVFEEVYRWCVHSPDDEEEEDKTSVYEQDLIKIIKNIASQFEQDFVQYQELLENKLSGYGDSISDQLKIAGTIKLPSSKFDDDSLESGKKEFTNKLDEISERWQICTKDLSVRAEALVNTVKLKERLRAEEAKTGDIIGDFFGELENGPHHSLQKIVEEASEKLSSGKTLSHSELESVCDVIIEDVKTHLEEAVLKELNKAAEDHRLSKALNEYVEEVMILPSTQPEKAVLTEHLDLKGDLPAYDTIEVQWQWIIRSMLSDYVAKGEIAKSIEPESYLKSLIQSYKEIAQIVETNLDLVEEVTSKEEEKPVDIAIQGMERALTKISETGKILENARMEINEKIVSQNDQLFAELIGFLNKDDFGDVKWIQTQLKVRESAGDWKTKWTVFWANFVDRFDLFRRFLMRKYRSWSEVVLNFLGKENESSLSTEKMNLAAFLYETNQKFNELPFIYRRLFDFQREIDRSFYINDPVHFEMAKKSYDLFKDGFPSSLVITGEKGSGKSTLNRFLMEETLDVKQYRLSQDKTIWTEEEVMSQICKVLELNKMESADELITAIKKKRKGSIVVIENIQNFFIRAMSGYGGIKTLLSVIAETKTDVFWVITSSRYAWNFLQVYLKLGEHFSHSLSTDELTADEIRSVIMKRHKASGYQLRFLPDIESEKSRTFRKFMDDEEAQQEFLMDKYFEKLTSVAEGNATVAMIYWFRSISEFTENEVNIQNIRIQGTELLGNLEPNSLFALSSFVLHDTLTSKELAKSMHCSESEAYMIISRLNTSGLLVKSKGSYSLNLLIYRQVVRVLKLKNILH